MNYLNGLNDEQREAVLATEGPLLVVAGAGTGKTKTLTHRIYHLVQQGVAPSSILAITFTNKAAKEMRERVLHLMQQGSSQYPAASASPYSPYVPFVSTFHSLGVYLLRTYGEALGLKKSFTILDQSDSVSLLKDVMTRLDIDPKQWDPKRILNRISKAKGDLVDITLQPLTARSPWDDMVNTIWPEYEREKSKHHLLDFSDLLLKSYHLLNQHQQIKNQCQKVWTHVHIDEYQDTNKVQYELSKLLVGPDRHICAVGDGDQNIYTWRGADVRNILKFEKDFPGAKVVLLEKNYRSTKNILSAAHEIIRKNKARIDKKLYAQAGAGEQLSIYQAFNEQDEANWVASTAQDFLRQGYQPQDIAILFRTNFQSRVIEEAMMAYQIPYQVLGIKFFDRREVKDVLSYVRAALNDGSLIDLKRTLTTPKRGLGKVSITHILSGDLDKLSPKATSSYEKYRKVLTDIQDYSTTHTASELITFAIRHSGIEAMLREGTVDEQERLENIKELVSFATRYDDMGPSDGILRLLEDATLMSDQDNDQTSEERSMVRLMTIHASKGLEFPIVFVVGMEQGLFPAERDGEVRDAEEERRLCYVAFTRAKERLLLSYANMRRIFGQQKFAGPSEFLTDIPTDLYASATPTGRGSVQTKTNYLDIEF